VDAARQEEALSHVSPLSGVDSKGRVVDVQDEGTFRVEARAPQPTSYSMDEVRISAIVDAHFRLIVDGKSGAVRGALGKRARCRSNGTQSSTIRLKCPAAELLSKRLAALTPWARGRCRAWSG
jgi:hypothetical protein